MLLALLSTSLLLTAIIVQKTYTSKNNLYQTAQTLEDNLHKKEEFVRKIIDDKASFDKLKHLKENEQEAIKIVNTFTTQESIWVITTNNGRLEFWSGIKVIPDHPESIREGYSFVKEANGYYDIIKKSEGGFSAIFLIPVKINYPINNKYLQNTFAKNLLNDKNIEIANASDRNIYSINSIDHTFLFSVKVRQNQISHKFFYFEVIIWALCAMVFCLLMNSIGNFIANKGYVYLSFVTVGIFIVLIRFMNLHYSWPDFGYRPQVFNPQVYRSDNVFASLGDLCLNILCICWFCAFVYRHRDKLLKHVYNKTAGYALVIACALLLITTSYELLMLFYGLVVHSKIIFDVNNVLNLSYLSVLGVIMLCFSYLIFYLLTEICLSICTTLTVPARQQIVLLLAAVAVATTLNGYNNNEFTLFYILAAVWILMRGYAHRYDQGRINSGSLVIIILLCAVASAIKLNHFQSIKERGLRETLVQKLETPDDPSADYIFRKIEKEIVTDTIVKRYFIDSVHNKLRLKNYLQKFYFDGYLSKYGLTINEFNNKGESVSGDKNFELSIFSDMVAFNSYFKVSAYFYRDKESFGYQKYLALLPVFESDDRLGTIAIELSSQSFHAENSFPELLMDGNTDSEDDFKDYSYAFYTDKKLVGQKGKYDYSLTNNEFTGEVRQYLFKTTSSDQLSKYGLNMRYSHIIYKPNKRNLIVVSKAEDIIVNTITSITFFFIVFLVFSVGIIIMRWTWGRIRILYIADNLFHWVFKLNFDKILYKTRIQFSIVFAVVVTLVLVGVITYISIVDQYVEQQDDMISDKISRIAKTFKEQDLLKIINNPTEDNQTRFDEFANTNSTDLTLFKPDGVELMSTQPKIYSLGLQADRINARAYINLNKLQKSLYLNDEKLGELSYKAAYVPLKEKNRTVGYLQLPYFSNEADYKSRVGSLLNAMINIYALIFIAIGLLAVIIARQITNPLNIIQYGLSKTIYGQKNEPIKWERNDEIGALVKEYNNMIAALERSAQKLAQSERESAWREMAKQVAHEIKNPLTPLKLGLQLLEKSWKDKDPKFDQKFERFSKSFVEQIESLSSIASEFSAFAKMPDTRIERIDIFDMLTQAVTIFKQMDNIKILYIAPENPFYINADRDQLLRCFNNLLKNAIEATPPDRFGIIDINYLITSKNILLSIKDNGYGIPENLREKIFEPNFTTKSSGTGLGLAFVKNSIENAGGKVWFETVIGTGTTFYFSLPES